MDELPKQAGELSDAALKDLAERLARKHGLQFQTYEAWRSFQNARGGRHEVMADVLDGYGRFFEYVRAGIEWAEKNKAAEGAS